MPERSFPVALTAPAVTIEYGAQVTALDGDERLKPVTILSDEGEERQVDSCALFIMVAAETNTG